MNHTRRGIVAATPVLSSDLCARVGRHVEDPGPGQGLSYLTNQEYDALMKPISDEAKRMGALWLFAYGSLIWKPEVSYLEHRVGSVRGLHRSFCLKTMRWRGTPERPGLMMALEKGGQCRGIVYRLDPATQDEDLTKLVRRELGVKPLNHHLRWVRVATDVGEVRALTFVANKNGRSYAGKLRSDDAAILIARACGVWGSCAEYLHQTITHLDAFGIRDRGLWYLQSLVARTIIADLEEPDEKACL